MTMPSYDVDLNIAAIPETSDPELFYELSKIHASIRSVADAITQLGSGVISSPLPGSPAGETLFAIVLDAPLDLSKPLNVYFTAGQIKIKNSGPTLSTPTNAVLYNNSGIPSANILGVGETVNVTRAGILCPLPQGTGITWTVGTPVYVLAAGMFTNVGPGAIIGWVIPNSRMAVYPQGLGLL